MLREGLSAALGLHRNVEQLLLPVLSSSSVPTLPPTLESPLWRSQASSASARPLVPSPTPQNHTQLFLQFTHIKVQVSDYLMENDWGWEAGFYRRQGVNVLRGIGFYWG